MTVLQRREPTDEEADTPPRKKIRLAAKCLNPQTAADCKISIQAWLNESSASVNHTPLCATSNLGEMVNGYDTLNHAHTRPCEDDNTYGDYNYLPITPLLNLGNTCFLNSVLYTLRFAPSFLHKLHHLNLDSISFVKSIYTGRVNQEKTHSLGRNFNKPGTFWNNKELMCVSSNSTELKMQQVIERLHHLYQSLTYNEYKSPRIEPFQPNVFLHALREVNPIFEGNQQQDAHELLVCMLDIIREACEVLYQQNSILERPQNLTPSSAQMSSSSSSIFKIYRSLKKSFKTKKGVRGSDKDGDPKDGSEENDVNKYVLNDVLRDDQTDSSYAEENATVSNFSLQNTIFEDFQGVSILCTTCLECEQVTERTETFCDICVPIETSDCDDLDLELVNKLYHSVIVTEEYLMDCNKYWCDRCIRYNEAKRCVRYQSLPRLLTLHLKRFSSTYGSIVSKVNEYMPTPLILYCFCEECCNIERLQDRPHVYELYAIIMHLGATIASGHYVAYVKAYENASDYHQCREETLKTSSLSRNFNSSTNDQSKLLKLFKKNNKNLNGVPNIFGETSDKYENREKVKTSCKGMDCCGVRLKRIVNPIDRYSDSEPIWLECDDECVRTITTREFVEMLGPGSMKGSPLTPYLLFYARTDS